MYHGIFKMGSVRWLRSIKISEFFIRAKVELLRLFDLTEFLA